MEGSPLVAPAGRVIPAMEQINPEGLLNNAVAFHEAGTRCYQGAPCEISSLGGDVFLGAPSVVCYAFAIELYLKLAALLTSGAYDRREHRLDILERLTKPGLAR